MILTYAKNTFSDYHFKYQALLGSPKNENFVIIYSSSSQHKRMSETKQLMLRIDSHSIFFPNNGSQWGPSTVWFPIFIKISFVFSRRKIKSFQTCM